MTFGGKIANPSTSSPLQFAGDIINRIIDWSNDVNIAATDSTKKVQISSPTIYRSGFLYLSDTDKSHAFQFTTPNLTADKILIVPVPIGGTDTVVLNDTPATLTGKIFNFSANTVSPIVNADISASAAIAYSKLNLAGFIANNDISASAAIAYSKLALSNSIRNSDVLTTAAIAYSKLNLANSITDTDVAAHTSSKITINAKGQLNNQIVFKDQANTYGDFDQIFRSSRVRISNPANTFFYTVVGSAIIANRNILIPLIAADDTLVLAAFGNTFTGVNQFANNAFNIQNPAQTFKYIFASSAITADRTITWPLLTGNDTATTDGSPSTFTNKNLDARGTGNVLSNIEVNPLVKRTGKAQPVGSGNSAATVMVLDGMLVQHVPTGAGTNTVTFDTTEGQIANYVSTATANQNIGLVSPTTGLGIGRRLFGARIVTRAKINNSTSSRYYFGTTNAGVLPISDTPLATGDSGIIVGFSGASTNWTIFHNDGTGAAIQDNIAGPIAKDANFHTIEIGWTASGNPTVIFDGVAQTPTSTRIPATTQDQLFNCVGQTTTTTARTFSIHSVWVEADK